MATPPLCKGCGQPIRGAVITALGATWHPEHFRCAACGQPIGDTEFYSQNGMAYHGECYRRHVAARCAYCCKPLVDQYVVDHWGTKFCPDHQGQYPRCPFCGRLVPPHHQGRSASRGEGVRCPICRANAIEFIAQARPLFAELVRWVNSQGLKYNDLHLRIELRNRVQLAQFLRQPDDTQSLGATLHTSYTENGRVVRTQVEGVAILRGLPRTLFMGVTAHEMGHAWLAVHAVADLPRWAEEGFCELLAYRLYTEMATTEGSYHAECIELSTDPVYGYGFRRIQALADSVGFQCLEQSLRTSKRLPTLR